jgi:DNA-binding XRE family transcriptional regulator
MPNLLNRFGRALGCFNIAGANLFDGRYGNISVTRVNLIVDRIYKPAILWWMLDLEKIKVAREKAGLTQQQAAESAGFKTRQAWNRIENGAQANIGLDTLAKIAKVLKVKPRDLLK